MAGPAFEKANTDAAAHYWEKPARCGQHGAAPIRDNKAATKG